MSFWLFTFMIEFLDNLTKFYSSFIIHGLFLCWDDNALVNISLDCDSTFFSTYLSYLYWPHKQIIGIQIK